MWITPGTLFRKESGGKRIRRSLPVALLGVLNIYGPDGITGVFGCP
jgi:hypothetical protein